MYIREKFYAKLPTMPDAVSMDVSEPAQWFLRDDERMTYHWEEFPSLVPPFQDFWMEFQFPKQLCTDAGTIQTPHFIGACGVLLHAMEISPEKAESIRGRHYEFLDSAMQGLSRGSVTKQVKLDGDDDSDIAPRWLVLGQTVLANERQMELVNLWTMTLDNGGRFIRHTAAPIPWGFIALMQHSSVKAAQTAYLGLSSGDKRGWLEGIRDEYEPPFLFCLSLLHCRNIEVEEKPPQPQAVAKQRAGRGIPEIRYKMLKIPVLHGARRQDPGRQAGEPEPKALHFVRGHFKDFSTKGLFGKYKGVYWWGDQVRGDSAHGVLDKDYRLARD